MDTEVSLGEHDPNSKWKGAYLARVNIMGGGCWYRSHKSKEDALNGLARQLKADWGHLFDIPAALKKGIEVPIYRDAGTSSWDDDEYLETMTLQRG